VRPAASCTPTRPGARHLKDGERVRLYSDRGSVGLVLKVSDEVQPGNALVPGQRPDGETVVGTINILCSDRYTDIGEGATYQSTWLDIAVWEDRAR
jgi:anaerobic selenocysteine-containing dehydrogenase